MKQRKLVLSTLWIFVMLNYLYCDVLSFMDADILSQYLTGSVDGMVINETVLFYGAILMEIPIAMVLLSRLLPFRWNKVCNIIAGLIKTLAMMGTFFIGDQIAAYYLFFAVIEVSATIFIVGYAWTWKNTSDTAYATTS